MNKKNQGKLAVIAYFSGGFTCFLILFSWCGPYCCQAEWCATLLPVWSLFLLLNCVVLAFLKRWRFAGPYTIILLFSLVALAPVLKSAKPIASEVECRVLSFNIHSSNKTFGSFQQWLKINQPDIVLIQEMTPVCESFLKAELNDLYPIQKIRARTDNFGIGILVHKKYLGRDIDFIEHELANDTPVLEMRLGATAIFNVHLMPPLNNKLHQIRETQFKQLANLIHLSSPKVLVGGDFNCVPWARSLKNFLDDADLDNELPGFRPSWPASRPLLPLDHFFWRGAWGVNIVTLESNWGSDHLPLQLKLKEVI